MTRRHRHAPRGSEEGFGRDDHDTAGMGTIDESGRGCGDDGVTHRLLGTATVDPMDAFFAGIVRMMHLVAELLLVGRWHGLRRVGASFVEDALDAAGRCGDGWWRRKDQRTTGRRERRRSALKAMAIRNYVDAPAGSWSADLLNDASSNEPRRVQGQGLGSSATEPAASVAPAANRGSPRPGAFLEYHATIHVACSPPCAGRTSGVVSRSSTTPPPRLQ